MPYARLVYPNWIEIIIPQSWKSEETAGILNLYQEEGVGVLHLSFSKRLKETKNLQEDLSDLNQRHISKKELNKNEVEINIQAKKEYLISNIEYLIKEDYWKVWYLIDSKKLIFITYNCSVQDKNKEKDLIQRIVSSIKFI